MVRVAIGSQTLNLATGGKTLAISQGDAARLSVTGDPLAATLVTAGNTYALEPQDEYPVPVIFGTVNPGNTLSIQAGPWTSYQWLADGVPISGATSPTYELTELELGAMISISVGLSVGGTTTSATVGPVVLFDYSIYPRYSTVALGIAGVADGAKFRVQQPTGSYDFLYERTGTSATFIQPVAVDTAAVAWQSTIAAAEAAYASAGAPTDGKLFLAASAIKWGGRLLQNINAAAAPTLNLVDPIISLRDGDGGTTPALAVSADTDPLGNLEATALTFAANNVVFVGVNRTNYPGWTTSYQITTGIQARTNGAAPGGPSALTWGATDRNAARSVTFTATSSWGSYTANIDAFSNTAAAYNIGLISPASTGTFPAGFSVYGEQIYADSGPVVLPSLADERAGLMAGHAKAAVGFPGALAIDINGWITPGANVPNAVIPLGRPIVTEYAFGGWVDFTKDDYPGAFVALMEFGNTRDTGTTTIPTKGTLGMEGVSGNNGRVYFNPSLSTVASRVPTVILDQGPVHIFGRVKQVSGDSKTSTLFVNGVPMFDQPETIAAFTPEVMMLGGSVRARGRFQSGNGVMLSPDRYGDAYVEMNGTPTDDEVSAIYLAAKSRLAAGQEKMLVIGSFDSRTAFTPAPFWKSINDASLRPGVHGALEAQGGTYYGSVPGSGNYVDPTRQALRRRMLEYGARHYDEVYWLCDYGTNDLNGGGRVMDPNSTTWQAGRNTIDAMIQADLASVNSAYRSKIKLVLATIAPMGGWGSTSAVAADIARENARIAYNADCLANYASRGFDYVIDWETYVPSGFASLKAAAVNAFDTATANNTFLSDGIHHSATGGVNLAANVLTPFLAARRTALLA